MSDGVQSYSVPRVLMQGDVDDTISSKLSDVHPSITQPSTSMASVNARSTAGTSSRCSSSMAAMQRNATKSPELCELALLFDQSVLKASEDYDVKGLMFSKLMFYKMLRKSTTLNEPKKLLLLNRYPRSLNRYSRSLRSDVHNDKKQTTPNLRGQYHLMKNLYTKRVLELKPNQITLDKLKILYSGSEQSCTFIQDQILNGYLKDNNSKDKELLQQYQQLKNKYDILIGNLRDKISSYQKK